MNFTFSLASLHAMVEVMAKVPEDDRKAVEDFAKKYVRGTAAKRANMVIQGPTAFACKR